MCIVICTLLLSRPARGAWVEIPEQVSDYALNSPLGMAMKAELLSRGVNVENYLSMIEGPETL